MFKNSRKFPSTLPKTLPRTPLPRPKSNTKTPPPQKPTKPTDTTKKNQFNQPAGTSRRRVRTACRPSSISARPGAAAASPHPSASTASAGPSPGSRPWGSAPLGPCSAAASCRRCCRRCCCSGDCCGPTGAPSPRPGCYGCRLWSAPCSACWAAGPTGCASDCGFCGHESGRVSRCPGVGARGWLAERIMSGALGRIGCAIFFFFRLYFLPGILKIVIFFQVKQVFLSKYDVSKAFAKIFRWIYIENLEVRFHTELQWWLLWNPDSIHT